jgi:hypothetical protein
VHATGDVGVMALAVRNDTPANLSGTNGDYEPLQISAGRLWVSAQAQGNVASAATDSGNPVKIGGIFNTTQPTVTTGQRVNAQSTNRGALIVAAGVEGLQAVGNVASAATDSGNPVKIGGIFNTTQPTVTTGQRVNAQATNRGAMIVAPGVESFAVQATSISAGNNLIGNVGISGARTAGGTTIYRNLDVDEADVQIKATAGQVYWIHAMNLTAAKLYLKFYNATAATVVVGTTTPVMTFPVATQGDTNGAGFVLSVPSGIVFGTAITIACTTGIADADTGAPAANAMVVHVGYA